MLADESRWGFTVVPVLREHGQLRLGPDQFFRFETEGWVFSSLVWVKAVTT